MGLGKTLQTLCMVASDTNVRKQEHTKTGRMEYTPLPSLIICPSSVVGHWSAEVQKFFESSILSPFMYVGSSTKRAKYDVVEVV